MYKQYLKLSFISFLIIIILVSMINFLVDPGEIYYKRSNGNITSEELADKIYTSKNGVIRTGWNERVLKTSLAKNIKSFDCIILGSSHIMQISGIQNTGNINNQCKKTLNLGVSGGSLEDLSIFSYLILHNKELPKKVFLGIDPWTLKFNMDSRYGAYKNYYNKMNELLKDESINDSEYYLVKLFKNLINGEYLYQSISLIIKNIKNGKTIEKSISFPKNIFSYTTGYIEPIILKDGSHIYSEKYILDSAKKIKFIPLDGGNYKISGAIYQKKAINYFTKILNLYKQNNIDVNLIMTPYHPNIFKKGITNPVKYMKTVEKLIINIGLKNNVKTYGSFIPKTIGCKKDEFFDYMHPTYKCLNRIDFSK